MSKFNWKPWLMWIGIIIALGVVIYIAQNNLNGLVNF